MKMFEKLKFAFQSRSDSDKRALVALAVFFIAIGIYQLVIFAYKFHTSALEEFQASRNFLWSINSKAEIIKAVPAVANDLHGQSMLSIISSSAKQQDFVFQRIQPEGDNVLKLWMERVYFNNLLSWLYYLDTTAGISIQQISVEQVSDGYVNVRLTLVR